MDIVFGLFRDAHLTGKGYQLAETLMPVAPANQPDRLYGFYRSTNAANVQKDIRYNVLYDSTTSLKLSTEEGNSWVEVYVAYWKAVGEILKNEEARRTNSQV
jgi:COP9 signalosome complex subunit 12